MFYIASNDFMWILSFRQFQEKFEPNIENFAHLWRISKKYRLLAHFFCRNVEKLKFLQNHLKQWKTRLLPNFWLPNLFCEGFQTIFDFFWPRLRRKLWYRLGRIWGVKLQNQNPQNFSNEMFLKKKIFICFCCCQKRYCHAQPARFEEHAQIMNLPTVCCPTHVKSKIFRLTFNFQIWNHSSWFRKREYH